MNLKSWLRRQPMPTKLRLDGKRLLVIGNGKTKWVECLRSIDQLQPTTLEALNEEEHVLRVTTLKGAPEDDQDEDEKPSSKMTELATLARIITESNDRAAERHERAYALAFEKNYDLVQVLSDRMAGLETAWQTALAQRAKDLETRESETEEEDPGAAAIGRLFRIATATETGMTPAPAKHAAKAKATK